VFVPRFDGAILHLRNGRTALWDKFDHGTPRPTACFAALDVKSGNGQYCRLHATARAKELPEKFCQAESTKPCPGAVVTGANDNLRHPPHSLGATLNSRAISAKAGVHLTSYASPRHGCVDDQGGGLPPNRPRLRAAASPSLVRSANPPRVQTERSRATTWKHESCLQASVVRCPQARERKPARHGWR